MYEATMDIPATKENYFEKYVNVECERRYNTEEGKREDFACYLGESSIGKIEYTEYPMYDHRKKYDVSQFVDERHAHHIGSYATMVEAKRALFEFYDSFRKRAAEKTCERTAPVSFLPESDYQFYPTPSRVAGKLFSGINWSGVHSILEPSAGRGDLLDLAKRRCKDGFRCRGRYMYKEDIDDIDCVEIDANLQAMLKGKGYRVVHDDFLTYHTRKRYDLILMNPPFSKGDLHLLHALELCENGGQIACILNAETLLNPFTNSRKVLLKQLSKYNASIRYIDNAFSNAARRTDVSVALINISIPFSYSDTRIWDEMEKARVEHIESEEQDELAPSNDIERLILEYDLMCEAGSRLMRVYNGVSKRIMCSDGSYGSPIIGLTINGKSTDECYSSHINEFLRAARARYWRELFDLPELRKKMTSSMRDEYSNTIERMKDYDFSIFNIQQVASQIDSQLIVGIEEAIVKCFDKLSSEHAYHNDVQNENVHYYNGWKTNKAHYVNSKCIIPTWGCFAYEYKQDRYGRWKDKPEGLNVRGCFQVLDDLEKALDYLDNGETSYTNLEFALQSAASAGKTTVNCKYFTVTFYKKGTCHIKFHDQKIVDRLNIYVGRHRAWLPPSYGAVRYDEMDDESKRVVDEFQGREKYDTVAARPSDYIIDAKPLPLLLN